MEDTILDRGRKISESYYANSVFFRQLTLLTQSVVNILLDKNFDVKWIWKGKQFGLECFRWIDDQGFTLPKLFYIHFLLKTEENISFEASKTHYLWLLRFFPFNPKGNACWVPFGFFARVEMNAPRPLPGEAWNKIADTLRPIVFNNDLNSVCQVFGNNDWPPSLQGEGGATDFSKVITIPFPLAAISTSEDLSGLVEKALSALKENGNDLKKDPDFIQKYWGL